MVADHPVPAVRRGGASPSWSRPASCRSRGASASSSIISVQEISRCSDMAAWLRSSDHVEQPQPPPARTTCSSSAAPGRKAIPNIARRTSATAAVPSPSEPQRHEVKQQQPFRRRRDLLVRGSVRQQGPDPDADRRDVDQRQARQDREGGRSDGPVRLPRAVPGHHRHSDWRQLHRWPRRATARCCCVGPSPRSTTSPSSCRSTPVRRRSISRRRRPASTTGRRTSRVSRPTGGAMRSARSSCRGR